MCFFHFCDLPEHKKRAGDKPPPFQTVKKVSVKKRLLLEEKLSASEVRAADSAPAGAFRSATGQRPALGAEMMRCGVKYTYILYIFGKIATFPPHPPPSEAPSPQGEGLGAPAPEGLLTSSKGGSKLPPFVGLLRCIEPGRPNGVMITVGLSGSNRLRALARIT